MCLFRRERNIWPVDNTSPASVTPPTEGAGGYQQTRNNAPIARRLCCRPFSERSNRHNRSRWPTTRETANETYYHRTRHSCRSFKHIRARAGKWRYAAKRSTREHRPCRTKRHRRTGQIGKLRHHGIQQQPCRQIAQDGQYRFYGNHQFRLVRYKTYSGPLRELDAARKKPRENAGLFVERAAGKRSSFTYS
jgi:hypothetical protein